MATRSDLNPAGLAQPSTGSVAAVFLDGQLSVGGDLEIKSGDALVTATGPAGLISALYPLSNEVDVFQFPTLTIDQKLAAQGSRASITVGGTYHLHPPVQRPCGSDGLWLWLGAGSMVVSSGSITGLPDGVFTTGLAAFNLASSDLTASSVSVVSGHGHNGFVSLIFWVELHWSELTRGAPHTHTHAAHTQRH